MIGLIVYGTIFLVSIICIIIFVQAIKYAKRNKKSTLKYGSVTSIILFFLVTWDWLPSEIYYAYQCAQLPPLQVYKTPEQWVSENQDLIKGGKVEFKIKRENDIPRFSKEEYKLSLPIFDKEDSLFAYVYYREEEQFLRTRHTKQVLIDRRTGVPLISETLLHQVIRFYSPPLRSGGKHCGFKNKNANILSFLDAKEVKVFLQLQRNVNKLIKEL